jgi:MFS family permease
MSVLSALRISKAPAAAFAVVGIFWGSFAAQVPVLKDQIGANDATFGLLLLGTSFGLVSTMFLAPMFDAKMGPKAMPIACVLLALAFLFPGCATAPAFFFAAMLLAGMASGLSDVIMNARVSELEAATRKPLMNANHGMFSLAYAMSALFTGFAREAGFTPPETFACVGLVALCLVWFARMDPVELDEVEDVGGAFPLVTVLICGAVVLIAFMAEAATESWSALHVERTLNGGAAEGALGPTMLGLTMAVGRFGGQAVSERLSDLRVIFWAACMAATGAIIAALAPVPLVAYLGFGVLGLGVSVIGPLGLAIVGRMVPAKVRTTAISRAAVIGFMGFFVAPAMMGITSEYFGLRVAFASIAMMLMALFPLLMVLRRRGA